MKAILFSFACVCSCLLTLAQGGCPIVVAPDRFGGYRAASLQLLVDSASKSGNCVALVEGLYTFANTLRIPAGVSIHGVGPGTTTLSRPLGGTILRYTGKGTAISIEGSNTAIYDLSVEPAADATMGIVIAADSSLTESVVLSRVNLYGFTNGTALQLKAMRHGGIGYCSFYDLRIRHAKTGIHILEEGKGSFVNSNSFFHGAVSGGGFDVCLLVDGGDNNVFYSTVIEPYASALAHVYVRKGSFTGDNIRIEATRQDPQKPVLYFAPGTHASVLTGFFSGGRVVNEGDNDIRFGAPNYIGEQSSAANRLLNAWFNQVDENQLPNYWKLKGAARLDIDTSSPVVGAKVLSIAVAPHSIVELYPDPAYAPVVAARATDDHAGFSALVKAGKPGMVKLTYNYAGGLVSSVAHSGNGNWESLGMQVIVNRNVVQHPAIYIDNSNGDDSAKVAVTTPSFAFGMNPPLREAAPINSNGGIFTGSVAMAVCRDFTYDETNQELILPTNGNLFVIQRRALKIRSINSHHPFAPGTTITLLFEQPWTSVKTSKTLSLKSDFVSNQAHTSLSLLSNGDGSWTEIGRNN